MVQLGVNSLRTGKKKTQMTHFLNELEHEVDKLQAEATEAEKSTKHLLESVNIINSEPDAFNVHQKDQLNPPTPAQGSHPRPHSRPKRTNKTRSVPDNSNSALPSTSSKRKTSKETRTMEPPRKKASISPAWKPPQRSSGRSVGYRKPGHEWVAAQKQKMLVLRNLNNCMKLKPELSSHELNFGVLMYKLKFKGGFNEKIFVYLLGLKLLQNRYVHLVVVSIWFRTLS